jgi:hypothetical protein
MTGAGTRRLRTLAPLLAELVRQHEGRAIRHVEIAAELESRNALGAVDEDGDGQEIVANRELAAGENGARRDAELARAADALPNPAGLVGIESGRAAARAIGLAAIGSPADLNELGSSLMRATDATESVLAALERRKCCATGRI